MSWDYAELSKAAKKAGGPEKLMELITDAAKQEGHSEMVPVVVLAAGIGALAALAVRKLISLFKKKRIPPEEIEAAKAEIIQGIKDYDAEHPEELLETENVKEEKEDE